MAHIKIQNLDVTGIDISKRALSLRSFLLGKGKQGGDDRIPILKKINFEAQPGDRIGLVGKNGCGKSSLLKAIAGIYPPEAGSLEVEGSIAPLIEMGLGFDPELTGRQNIKLGLIYSGRIHEYSIELEEKIINFSELGDNIDLPFKNYSSGMCARLAFSTAVFQKPDVLLLDEVFAVGDSGFLEKSKQFMLNKLEHVPIAIMVNHSRDLVLELCNKCYLMEKGEIIMSGSPADIMNVYEKSLEQR